MAGRKSKNKGANFEREVCYLLSGMWDPKLDLDKLKTKELPFGRTPYSGADKRFPLDIMSPSDFPWLVEARKREIVFTVENLLMGDSPIIAWLRKAEEDVKLTKIKKPVLLVAARNHVKPIVVMRAPDILIPSDVRHMHVAVGNGTDLLGMSLEAFVGLGKDFWMGAYDA